MALLSPGVLWREFDFSAYVQTLAGTTAVILGHATTGPIGVPTRITNRGELYSIFGPAYAGAYGLLAAKEYLLGRGALYFVRVASSGTPPTYAVADFNNTAPTTIFKLRTRYKGAAWNKKYRGVLTRVAAETGAPFLYNFEIQLKTGPGDGDDAWSRIEGPWYKLTFNPDSTTHDYIETAVNLGRNKYNVPASAQLEIVDLFSANTDPDLGNVGTSKVVIVDNGINGNLPNTADVMGTDNGYVKTGLQSVRDFESLDFNLLLVPGADYETIVEGLEVCRSRGDCTFPIDTPYGLNKNQVADWHNGAGIFDEQSPLNSSYGYVQWGWGQIYDSEIGDRVWVPPSGAVARIIAQTDATYGEAGRAAAGLVRGQISSWLDTEVSPSKADRDFLYSGGNVINCITNSPLDGVYLNGQRTLQRLPTSLDRVKPRRVLCYLQKTIAAAARYLVFDPNDPQLWKDFTNLVTPVFERAKASRQISEYQIVMDSSTNPASLINAKGARALLKLKLTPDMEFLQLDFALYAEGAEFSDV
jgi:hypothetical protein